MAQETWGLKLDPELKEKIQEIIKTDFDSSKEFMEQLVSMYELHELKQSENIFSQEVDELESLTRRINGIFINANGKINTLLQDKDLKALEQIDLKQKLVERFQIDIARLEDEKQQIGSINDSLVLANTEYQDQVNQLTQSNNTLHDLINEYKEKNDTLTGLLQEYKQDHENNKILEQENRTLSNQINTLEIKLAKQTQALDSTNHTLNEALTSHKVKLQELLTQHTEALEATKQKAELDANLTRLELQQEHQSKLQNLQEKHHQEIEQYQTKHHQELEQYQAKYHQEIEQYQAKYKQLLEKIESMEITHQIPQKSKSKQTPKG